MRKFVKSSGVAVLGARYYAGPVKQQVRCAYWGGSHGDATWVSPSQYRN